VSEHNLDYIARLGLCVCMCVREREREREDTERERWCVYICMRKRGRERQREENTGSNFVYTYVCVQRGDGHVRMSACTCVYSKLFKCACLCV